MTHLYRYCGLLLDAQEPISALASSAETRTADITIRHSCLKPPAADSEDTGPNWLISRDEAWWWLPESIYFRVRHRRIDIDARDIEDSLVHALLLEAPMVMAMIFQGTFCLNAAAAVKDGRTMVFCGAAGSGRSTAVARIALHGGKLLTDSLARVDLDQRGPQIFPQGSGALLWPTSHRRLGIKAESGELIRSESLIRRVQLDQATTGQRLDRLYWRNPYPETNTLIENDTPAKEQTERQRFRKLALITAGRLWIDAAGRTAEHFRWCVGIARHCQLSAAPESFFDDDGTEAE